jgi:UDP:flavonoid glycosyltransferase YjiC (YdhE family)
VTLLVVSPDYASHLFPLMALAGPWAAAGERVVVATGPAVAPLVERAGFEWLPLVLGRGANPGVARAHDQPSGEDENLRAFFRATHDGMIPTLRLQAELRRNDLLWRPVEAARATIDVVRAVAPDAILVDHLAFGATLGLRAARIRYADVVLGHPTALPVAGERYGVPRAWPAAFRPDSRELAGLERLADEVAGRFTGDWNRALRAIDPTAAAVDDAFRAHGDMVLFNYPAALHDAGRSKDLPAAHAFLGSSVRDEALDPDAAAWLGRDAGRPLVVVSFGSFLSARADVLARVASALRRADVRVALATGSADRGTLGALPDDWLVRQFLPQVALVRHAAVAITHGGNGGVTEALTHGVPVLALPFSTDQFAVAADLERTGVGRAADPNRVTDAEVREAVLDLLGGSLAGAALDLGQQLRADPGPARARHALTAVPAVPAVPAVSAVSAVSIAPAGS